MATLNSISRPVEIGLRITGIWPGLPGEFILRTAWIAVLGALQVFQYWYVILHLNSKDLPTLIDGLSTVMPQTLLSCKLIILWYNRGTLLNVMKEISNDWQQSAAKDSNMNIMISSAILSERCSKFIISVYALAVSCYSIAFFKDVYTMDRSNIDIHSRELLMKMQIPSFFYHSPYYECVVFAQFLQLTIVASAVGLLDAFILTLILHIGGQIDIMYNTLSEISSKDAEGDHFSRSVIKSLIAKHYKIITFSGYIDKLFTRIALLQFLSNTFIICCIGFTIVTSLSSENSLNMLIKSTFFYIAITLEAFIFCFCGEYLSSKSTRISDEAYSSLWYLLKPNDSRLMLLLMVRSQKRITITAGKFMDLSLESFLGILKASASYVSVLHAMY